MAAHAAHGELRVSSAQPAAVGGQVRTRGGDSKDQPSVAKALLLLGRQARTARAGAAPPAA